MGTVVYLHSSVIIMPLHDTKWQQILILPFAEVHKSSSQDLKTTQQSHAHVIICAGLYNN